MYDLSSKFNSFYSNFVVLSQEDRNELYSKKELNLDRLKNGLKEYNEEYGTNYSIADSCVQGSVAMSTVVQTEKNDYDIDVAVVFDKSCIGDKGARSTRNMVADALGRKTKQFNAEPEVKTNCVRIKYADGYHIDFAIYRREWDSENDCWFYEHAGSEWTVRDLKGLTEWFNNRNDVTDGKLRRVVRLSKMFCKSRDAWVNMPSGILQTILCDEQLQLAYERIDELFYFTMKAIVDRLEQDCKLFAPVDNGRDLTSRQIDLLKMTNWKNRLKSKLEDLEVLFDDECESDDALQAWYGFFNHEYWGNELDKALNFSNDTVRGFTDTEQFIEDLYPVDLLYDIELSCQVSGNGFRKNSLSSFLSLLQKFLPHNFTVDCSVAYTNVPVPYNILWKVKNVGPEAQRRNDIRGDICNRGSSITENTMFYGNHYIECYIIKNGICVARKKITIPIGR